ncbi:unnamed protein product [Rotaria sp. Silwood1]|nr:unnamed protein product [Rotaria sp. Silwood1]CAF5124226.1 unnamed protein product [Rotaria sp. Silwood1]
MKIEFRVVSSEEGRSLANAWKVQFVEASAMDIRAVHEICEKSIKAMDNIDTNENGINEYSNEKVNSRRSSNSSANINSNSKQIINRNLSKTQTHTNKTCLIS